LQPTPAPIQQQPTPAPAKAAVNLAPPKPVELPSPPKPAAEPPAVSDLPLPAAEAPAAEAPGTEAPAAEAPATPALPGLPDAAAPPKPAESRPSEAQPAKRSMEFPPEKPLIAQLDNPFILEADQLQIWTDASGSYRVEARFISFDDNAVRLQRADGQFVRIAYDRLSTADRERVHDLSYAVAMKMSMK